jgi:hypothetical protein
MKNGWLLLFLAGSFAAQGQTNLRLTNWTFTNLQGQVYSNTTLRTATPTNIAVAWEPYGYAKIDFTNLPGEVRQMFHYDSNKVAVLTAKEEAAGKANAEAASARRGTPLVSTSPVDIILARHIPRFYPPEKPVLTIEKTISWNSTYTNLLGMSALEYTLVVRVDPVGFGFISYRTRRDFTKELKDQEQSAMFEDRGRMGFKHGEEMIANEAFNKFLEWEAIASKADAETFEKPLAIFPGSGRWAPRPGGRAETFEKPLSIFPDPDASLIRKLTFQWHSDVHPDRTVDERAWLWASEDLSHNNAMDYGMDFHGLFHKVEITNFQVLMKSIPELKQELAEKLERRDAQTNLFK